MLEHRGLIENPRYTRDEGKKILSYGLSKPRIQITKVFRHRFSFLKFIALKTGIVFIHGISY